MSKVRLDAATLEYAVARIRKIADEMNADAQGAMCAGQLAQYGALDFYVDELRIALNSMIGLASEAESAPPRLSSLVAACEGTALGEPAWEAIDDVIVAHFDSGAAVHIDTNIPARATMWTSDTYERMSLPEIRPALEALAKDAKP